MNVLENVGGWNLTLENVGGWNLTHIFKDKQSFIREKNELIELSKEFKEKFYGNLNSAKNLLNALEAIDILSEKISSVFWYIYLQKSLDQLDEEICKEYLEVENLINECYSFQLFLSIQINKIDKKQLKAFQSEEIKLKEYEKYINYITLFRKYELSEEVETVLNKMSTINKSSWENLFEELSAKLRYKTIDGKEVNQTEMLKLSKNKNPEVRKSAINEMSRVLKENSMFFTYITNNLAKYKSKEQELRGVSNPMLFRNMSNLVENKTVDTLHDISRKNFEQIVGKYYKLKSKLFKKPKLEYHDRAAPLQITKNDDESYSYSDAIKIIKNSYSKFSNEFTEIIAKLDEEGHINHIPLPNKRGGAFCASISTKIDPYVLLTFHGKTRDVYTLAHELGHAIHFVLLNKSSKNYSTNSVSIPLAETASIFSEHLLFNEFVQNEKDENKKITALATKIEDCISTSLVQIAFSCFEKEVHEKIKTTSLSTKDLDSIWLKYQNELFKDSVDIPDNIGIFWSYIPHFISSPFYVYSYAFASCLVNSLYMIYTKNPESFVPKYKQLLEQSNLSRAEDIMKEIFNIDISDASFWQEGLEYISSLIDQMENLCKKNKYI